MKDLWHGRFDSDEAEDLRLWQIMQEIDAYDGKGGACFIGYDTDDGVLRNKGRAGAAAGPNAIRTSIQSLPRIHGLNIYDYRNLHSQIMEEAQQEYGQKVADALQKGLFPIGLGGGHDISYGSYLGVRKQYPDKRIGIVNFDAHLDMRPYDEGMTSGTAFKKILDDDKAVEYAIVGFQKLGNTERLLRIAKEHKALILDVEYELDHIVQSLQAFSSKMDILYLTFCMDVFDVAFAPGVSAPAIMGLSPLLGKKVLRSLMQTGKVVCVDFAEVNPTYDIDGRTAKLAGCLAYDIISTLKEDK